MPFVFFFASVWMPATWMAEFLAAGWIAISVFMGVLVLVRLEG